MKMSKKKFEHILLVPVSIILIITMIGQISYGWFNSQNSFFLNASGESVKNYYASGDGTSENPFIISTPKHLYNLSWLQCKGVYDDKKYYFKLSNDIDMSAMAIVPIGSVKYPFYGSFIGDGHIISNLWISSIATEVDADLINFDDVDNGNIGGEYIGFFGNIGSKTVGATTLTGDASDFYLENIQVSTATANSYVGIVAGNNNGSLNKIGVSNAVIKLSNGGLYTSDYSLIGKNNVAWPELPGNAEGGKLLIDPNETPKFTSVSSGNSVQIPNSATDRSFFVGNLIESFGGVNTLCKYTGSLGEYDSTGKRTVTPKTGSNLQTVTSSNHQSLNVNSEFWTRFENSGNNLTYITSNMVPDFTNLYSQTLSDGTTLGLPKNCSWFKPITYGTCALAFNVQNMSSNASTAIYKFKRNADGTIDKSSILETNFTFAKNTFSNKNMIYFDYEITKQDVLDGYEFAIGKSTIGGSNQAYLFYMIIAGSSSDGGGVDNGASVGVVDYVYKTNGSFPDMSPETYKMTNTLLNFKGSNTGSTAKIYFNKLSNDDKVHYFNEMNGITIVDSINGSPNSFKESNMNNTVFPFQGYNFN